ncbi:peptide chain release factor H [Micromonospora rifamycinica]|uniref:peptide chain release factor H n=1 Tax=Micromonospora rifamycinica TaxID=291594 RepID=UPI0034034C12
MSVHLLLSAGRGPQECAWALARLLDRLEVDAGRHGVTTRRVETVVGDRPATYRSALVQLAGADVEGFAATWTGTLCWRAPSPYRPATGRRNWYVIARPCQVDLPTTTFTEADVHIVACRTGGPGGQHRNKASTAARATHRPSGLVVVVDTERQFGVNRAAALRLLRQRLADGDVRAGRAVTAARRGIHDELVRGDPVRVERPHQPGGSAAATGGRLRSRRAGRPGGRG